jgi:uncharacterized protein DUF4166
VTALPFEAAMGRAFRDLAPAVRAHAAPATGRRRVVGVMRSVWHRRGGWRGLAAAIGLRLAACTQTLFPDVGEEVPFEMENTVVRLADGGLAVTWNRTFRFPRRERRFEALMTYEPGRDAVVDLLGADHGLEVELHPAAEDGAIVLRSGRQWRRIGRVRVRLPAWLVGRATVRVWDAGGERLGVRVTVTNAILGDFFGYEGTFHEEVRR